MAELRAALLRRRWAPSLSYLPIFILNAREPAEMETISPLFLSWHSTIRSLG